jgi:hypothetical protein
LFCLQTDLKVGLYIWKTPATGVELTGVTGDRIFKDYLVRIWARLMVVRGKIGRTHRDAAGNCESLRTETD